MDTGETYRFQGAELKQEVKLLTIACRFVPYDQWLVTHVDSSWKINQVKSWILAKCVANSSSRSRPTPIFNLPLIHPPAKPKTKLSKRPASPIIFADFPLSSEGPSHSPGYHSDGQSKEDKAKRKKRRGRGRPISPITFAPIGVDLQDDSEEGSVTGKDEGEVIGMGYEEDDEWDSPEDGSDIDELELDPNPRVGRRANRNQYLGYYDRPSADQPTIRPPSATPRIIHSKNLVNPASLPRGSYTTYHPDLLNLIRFSTGQILERHCSLSDYEIKPYELLEVHRWGVVTRLPREITFKYIEPYWEGWVKALRLVFREPRVVIEARSQDREGPGRLKEASMNEMDGGYRETARKTMEVLAGGKVAPFSAADVALGLRPAPSSRGKSVKKSKRLGGNDLDIHTSVLKSSKLSNSSHYDASQSPTASTSKSGLTQSTSNNNNGYRSKGKGGKLEWRERWLFIKDGVLHLKKENSELSSTTTQILPLDSLTEIRNADQLGRTAPPSPSQWIVCAKFKTPITTTRAAVPESHNTTTYARQTSHSNITSNPMPYSTLKSPVNLPKPSSLSRGGSISHRGDSKHSTSAGYRASNVGPGRSTTSSSSTSKPKIMLQIKPLPPPAPTRIIPDTETSSSMVIAPKEKDKGKMAIASLSSSRLQSTSEQKIISDPEVFSGSGSENPSEAHTEEEDASSENETDTADLAEGKGKQRVTVASAINNRKHPQISIESDADLDGSGSTLSSPVFAHTEDDSPFSDGPARSYGYGYGHIGGTSEWRRKGGGAQEKNTAPALKRGGAGYEEEGENAEVDTSSVVVSGADDVAEGPRPIHGPNAKPTLPSRRSGNGSEKPDPESEWIVLDLGDDFAFKSFLRVIHRHAPHVVDSSFLSPPFQMPKPPNDSIPAAPAPTPTFTSSFPGPEQASSPLFGQWSWNTVQQKQEQPEEISHITPTNEVNPDPGPSLVPFKAPPEAPPNLNSSSVTDTSDTQTVSPGNAPRDSKQFRLPPSPSLAPAPFSQNSSLHTSPLLNTLGRRHSATKQSNIVSSQQKNFLGTFDALPYPEWRLEVVTKAQRAGMGELTRAMDQFLWGDNPGLTLLTRELGLSLAPMELIRSPSIQTAVCDRFSVSEEGYSTEDATSTRRQRKRKGRKMTSEQENIAIGLNYPGSGNMSSKTLINSGHHIPIRHMASISNTHVSGSHPERPRSSAKFGYIDADSSGSGEESSDAEWLGWMADLHRQAKLQREEDARLDRLETESLASSTDTNHYWDYQQQDDHRRYQDERKALEPTGVVTSSSPSPVVISTAQQQMNRQQQSPPTSTPSETTINRTLRSTASTGANAGSSTFQSPSSDVAAVGGPSILSSPSSNESLNRFHERRLSFGLSPSDPPSSATSPSLSQVGHSIEVSHHENTSRSHKHRRQISGMVRDGPNLSHYASTGLIGTTSELHELELFNSSLTSARRPSMPVLGSSSSTIRLKSSLPPIPTIKDTGTSRGQQSSEQPMPVVIPRRSSMTGSISSTSVGRSSSILRKAPGLLRKKGLDNVKVTGVVEKEEHNLKHEKLTHDRKQKETTWKGKGKEQDTDLTMQEYGGEVRSRRARLSLSLSTSQVYNPTNMPSPPPTSPIVTSKDQIRRNKSGQRLLSGEDGDCISTGKKEKKRGLVKGKAEKWLQHFESTLDFVDAR